MKMQKKKSYEEIQVLHHFYILFLQIKRRYLRVLNYADQEQTGLRKDISKSNASIGTNFKGFQ